MCSEGDKCKVDYLQPGKISIIYGIKNSFKKKFLSLVLFGKKF